MADESVSKFPKGQPPAVEGFVDRVQLKDVLEVSENSGRRCHTRLQKQHISEFKDVYKAMMNDPSKRGQFAVVDYSRTPTPRTKRTAGKTLRPDMVECLTASGPALHAFALGEGRDSELSLDRPLFPSERGRLQGFPEAVCRALVSDLVARRMFGNAMSVPVVGSVLAREIKALNRSKQASDALNHGCSVAETLQVSTAYDIVPQALHSVHPEAMSAERLDHVDSVASDGVLCSQEKHMYIGFMLLLYSNHLHVNP